MIDLKTINAVLGEFEDRGISRQTMLDAIENAMATAYKKEYGKRGQVVRAKLNMNTGTVEFEQVKLVVDDTMVRFPTEGEEAPEEHAHHYHEEEVLEEGQLPRYDSEKHILLEDAKRIKRGVELGEEVVFPLEPQDDFGRIAAQTAKQVVIQKVREAEKMSMLEEFGSKKGEIVGGIVQRMERGALFIDLGRATGLIPYEEQIPGERYRPGERIRAYLYSVDEGFRGVYLRLSRAHPKFVVKLFEAEVPEAKRMTARGIEVGHIFYFGEKYSKPMKATVTGPDGVDRPIHGGSYGVGVSRLVGGIIEASHDEAGIIWPDAVAPFGAAVVNLRVGDGACDEVAEQAYKALTDRGLDPLYDDRDERPGAKFASLDLVGIPWQLIVGPKGVAEGVVEIKRRATGERQTLPLEAALKVIAG